MISKEALIASIKSTVKKNVKGTAIINSVKIHVTNEATLLRPPKILLIKQFPNS